MGTDEIKPGGYWYKYFHPAVTADCIIFGFDGKRLNILLIERGNEPYLGMWALPGGFMKEGESIETTARRELEEETNLSNMTMGQFKVYSKPGRDPREQVLTVAFITLVRPIDYRVIAGDDASMARWFDVDQLPPLAFDHFTIIREAREHLKEMLRVKPVAFGLLDEKFSMSELQTLYEVVNEVTYDRRNFLRTALDSDMITEASAPADNDSRSQKFYRTNLMDAHDTLFDTDEISDNLEMSIEPPQASSAPYDIPERDFINRTHKASTKGLFDFLRKKR